MRSSVAVIPYAARKGAGIGASFYSSTTSTFNEYMTWAVFVLYAADTYEEPAFRQIIDETTALMAQAAE